MNNYNLNKKSDLEEVKKSFPQLKDFCELATLTDNKVICQKMRELQPPEGWSMKHDCMESCYYKKGVKTITNIDLSKDNIGICLEVSYFISKYQALEDEVREVKNIILSQELNTTQYEEECIYGDIHANLKDGIHYKIEFGIDEGGNNVPSIFAIFRWEECFSTYVEVENINNDTFTLIYLGDNDEGFPKYIAEERSEQEVLLNAEQVKFCDDSKFNKDQREQLRYGFVQGLTMEQVNLYANSKLDWWQMREIRLGFLHKLDMEQVMFYAVPKFNSNQMRQIRIGFESSLKMWQVALYSNAYSGLQMRQIRFGFEQKLNIEQIKLYTNPEFNSWQMEQIRYGFVQGLSMEQVIIYAQLKFDWSQMEQIRYGFVQGFSMEQVMFFATPKFDGNQMEQIRYGFVQGFSMEQIKLYADPAFEFLQMEQIRIGFEEGLSIEQVMSYAKSEFDWSQMEQIRLELISNK